MAGSKDSSTQNRLLSTGKTLFWKHGIRRVSVEEICREAGVSKMTFYRYFANKTELAKVILHRIFEEAMTKHRAIMTKDIPFAEKAREMLIEKFEATKELSQEFLMDFYKNPDLAPIIEKQQEIGLKTITDDFKKAKESGEIRLDIKLESIVYLTHKIHEMAVDQHFLSMFRNPQEAIMELTNFFFYGIGVKR